MDNGREGGRGQGQRPMKARTINRYRSLIDRCIIIIGERTGDM